MHPRIVDVKPAADYTIILTFTSGEVRVFDVKPYLSKGIFKELQDKKVFNGVKPFLGSIQWPSGQDFCPDTLYVDSVSLPDADSAAETNDFPQTGPLMFQMESA